ncbi:N-acetylgalactosamine 6-sulfate sulfatase [Puteibacter caeruleilacunae]|nr:N-acetylgalactosamine 6-sulfate sulfatase [Puteibacter caeruleilacunae]
MNRLSFIYILFVILALNNCSCTTKHQEDVVDKPNVIIVITDDQGYGDLGHTGNPVIKTPTIDAFAKQSISLTNYHVGTTCAPSRAGLMTARNCNRNGAWHTIIGASILNKDEVTMADVFKANGYSTGMFGKWHLGDNHPFLPHDRGFDEAFYHGGGGIGQTPDYWDNDYFDDSYFRNGKPEKKQGYCTDVWFGEAMKFIENKKDQPFFCYLSLNAPHSPYNVPEEYYKLYEDEEGILESQKRFYGMITNIDDNFKQLLAKLEELKIDKNTIVIYTTDNGTSNGYKKNKKTGQVYGYNAGMRGRKASEYDGGHRVPFIIRWPQGGSVGGKTLNELTAHVDILPTLASMAGISFDPEKVLDGTDISSYILHGKKTKKRMLVTDTQRVPWPIKGKQSCVMAGDWRLVNGNELYNLSKDPGQLVNVVDQYPEQAKEMNDFYNDWWEDVIAETKYSVIELDGESLDVITCMDIHSEDEYPNYNQKMIRQGIPIKPAKLLVNFTKGGKYKISLSRWPLESGYALGSDIDDEIPATDYTDARVRGKAIQFKKAYVKIGEEEYSVDVDNTKSVVSLSVEVKSGETDLTAWLVQKDGKLTNAYYIYIEKGI